MHKYFSFNPQRYDFWPVYETIKQYYPLGLRAQRDNDVLLQGYRGQERLQQLTADNIVDAKVYRSRWSTFRKELQAALKKRVHSDTSLFEPCFNGYIPLLKEQGASITYTKELRFCISFLGPYFAIYGLDASVIRLPESRPYQAPDDAETFLGFRRATLAVTVSPYQEYAALFTSLEQQIRLRFPGYRLLPFNIGLQLLDGLPHDSAGMERDQAVFEALFHSQHHLPDLLRGAIRGDAYYGMDEWRHQPQA